MRIIYRIQEPCYIFFIGYYARQSEYLERRIVGMDAYIYPVFFANRHDGSKEIAHVLAQGIAVDTLIQCQQPFKNCHRILISFPNISVDEALRLYDYRINKFILFGFGNHFIEFCHFAEFFIGIVLFGILTLQNLHIEVSKAHTVVIQRTGSVCPRMLQIGTYPVNYGHKVITDRFYPTLT